jgi:hypothetical protein
MARTRPEKLVPTVGTYTSAMIINPSPQLSAHIYTQIGHVMYSELYLNIRSTLDRKLDKTERRVRNIAGVSNPKVYCYIPEEGDDEEGITRVTYTLNFMVGSQGWQIAMREDYREELGVEVMLCPIIKGH